MSGCLRSHPPRRRSALLALVLLSGLAALAAGSASAQSTEQPFGLEVVAVQGTTSSSARVDLHTRIAYARLRFLSSSGGFRAGYELSADFYRADDRGRRQELVESRIWRRQVPLVRTYEATRSDTLFDFTIQAVPLPEPGRYVVEVRLEDQATRSPFVVEQVVEVPSFDRDLALSDLLLMERAGPERRMRPNVVNTLGTDQLEIIFTYEVYSRRPREVQLSYDVYRMIGRGRSMQKDDDPEQSLVAVRPTQLRRGRNLVTTTIPTNQLRVGFYTVVVSARTGDGTVLDSVEKTLAIQWMQLDTYVRDLDAAIAKMNWVAKKKDLEAMAAAPSEAERRRLFEDFWKKRDPTPRTERNERMEEYYYRVAYADQQYSVGRINGWETDRGQVFVRFGAPDTIERYPLPVNGGEAFEVWTYESLRRRFIFTEDRANGSFKLLTPIWSERTRIR